MTFAGHYTISRDDFDAMCEARVLWKAAWRRPRWIHRVLTVGVIALGVFYIVSPSASGSVHPAIGGFCAGGGILVFLLEFIVVPFVRLRAYKRQGLAERVVAVRADESGLDIAQASARSHIDWPGVIRTDRFRHGTVIWLTGRQPFFVPDRAFDTPATATAFHDYAKEQIAGAQTETS